MKDNPVAWMNGLINKVRVHFVEGMDLRTPEAGVVWQGEADQLGQEAKAGVKARSPDDAARLETLSPYPPADPPLGNPWWKPTPALGIVSRTSSVECEENTPLDYHLALFNRLEEIASDWRVNPPMPPIVATPRGRPGPAKPLKERRVDWMLKMRRQPGRTKAEVAREISKDAGVAPETVLREASRARTGR